jgi:hypothetical protein
MRRESVAIENDGWRWPLPKAGRDCNGNLGRHDVADLMDGHCALVRDDTGSMAPKGPTDEIVVRTPRPFPEPIHSAVFSNPIPPLDMIVLKLLWVADRPGLRGGEIPALRHGDLI